MQPNTSLVCPAKPSSANRCKSGCEKLCNVRNNVPDPRNGPGNSTDSAHVLALDSQGNVYVTGYSTGSATGYDYATIRYSQQ